MILILKKKKIKRIIFSIIIICILLSVAEFTARIISPGVRFHKYGWYGTNNQQTLDKIGSNPDLVDPLSWTRQEHGCEVWGDLTTNKKKILVVGDSFIIQHVDIEIDSEKKWYSYLNKIDYEVFACGDGGWGTLQEYMLIQDYFQIIEPDIILWQFHSNDFYNNNYEFDKFVYPNNDHALRPYFENDNIVYKHPAPLGNLRKKSRLVSLAMNIYDWFVIKSEPERYYKKSYVWEEIQMDQSINTTVKILSKAEEFGASIYLLEVEKAKEEEFETLCKRSGVKCIQGLPDYLEKTANQRYTQTDDQHWNEYGNKLAGQFLIKYFEKNE